MHHYTTLNDIIAHCFSPENPTVIYHVRSVFIFVAKCLTLRGCQAIRLAYLLQKIQSEQCEGTTSLFIPALAPNHCHCWTQLLVSAGVWRWFWAPEVLDSYSWLRREKEVFFMPSNREGSVLCGTRDSPWKFYVHIPDVFSSAVLETIAFFLVLLIPMLMLPISDYSVSLPMIFFFLFQLPGAEQWLCECWRTTGSVQEI